MSDNIIFNNKIKNCDTFGIYLNDSTCHNRFNNCRVVCDKCATETAEVFYDWRDKNFDTLIKHTRWKLEDYSKVHIIGFCKKCDQEIKKFGD